MDPEDFSCWTGIEARRLIMLGLCAHQAPIRQEPSALKSSIDAVIGPLQCVSRVMEAGSRVEQYPPCGDRICGRELVSRTPNGDYATNHHLCARLGIFGGQSIAVIAF